MNDPGEATEPVPIFCTYLLVPTFGTYHSVPGSLTFVARGGRARRSTFHLISAKNASYNNRKCVCSYYMMQAEPSIRLVPLTLTYITLYITHALICVPFRGWGTLHQDPSLSVVGLLLSCSVQTRPWIGESTFPFRLGATTPCVSTRIHNEIGPQKVSQSGREDRSNLLTPWANQTSLDQYKFPLFPEAPCTRRSQSKSV